MPYRQSNETQCLATVAYVVACGPVCSALYMWQLNPHYRVKERTADTVHCTYFCTEQESWTTKHGRLMFMCAKDKNLPGNVMYCIVPVLCSSVTVCETTLPPVRWQLVCSTGPSTIPMSPMITDHSLLRKNYANSARHFIQFCSSPSINWLSIPQQTVNWKKIKSQWRIQGCPEGGGFVFLSIKIWWPFLVVTL